MTRSPRFDSRFAGRNISRAFADLPEKRLDRANGQLVIELTAAELRASRLFQ
jgi:hypothetical protein